MRKMQSSLPTLLTSQTEIAEVGEKLRQEELLGSGAFAAVYLCSLDGQPRAKLRLAGQSDKVTRGQAMDFYTAVGA